jgi:hypothetical protein
VHTEQRLRIRKLNNYLNVLLETKAGKNIYTFNNSCGED